MAQTDCRRRLFQNSRNQLKVCNNLRTCIQRNGGDSRKNSEFWAIFTCLSPMLLSQLFLEKQPALSEYLGSAVGPVLLASFTCLMVPWKTRLEGHICIPPDSGISRVKILLAGWGMGMLNTGRHAFKKFKRKDEKWDKGTETLKCRYFPGLGTC